MQALKFVRKVVATFAALVVIMAAADKAMAQTQPITAVKTVLLIHGAWADSSCWSKVIPLLQARGLYVVAVQIPVMNEATDVKGPGSEHDAARKSS